MFSTSFREKTEVLALFPVRYEPVDNSCLEGSKAMVQYYEELYK